MLWLIVFTMAYSDLGFIYVVTSLSFLCKIPLYVFFDLGQLSIDMHFSKVCMCGCIVTVLMMLSWPGLLIFDLNDIFLVY